MIFALLSVVARVGDATLERVAAAMRIRGSEIATAWSSTVPSVVAPTVRVVSSVRELTNDDIPMVAVATLDNPMFLAEHSIRDGHPYGLILADDYQPISSIECAFGHEIAESMVDPSCDQYLSHIAREIGDPFQATAHPVDIGQGDPVALSAHALTAWFGLREGPTNSVGKAVAQLTCDWGGYYVRDDGSQHSGLGYKAPPHKDNYHTRSSKRRRALARARLAARAYGEG